MGQGLACEKLLRPLPLFVAILHLFSTIISSLTPPPIKKIRQNQGGTGERQQDHFRSSGVWCSALLTQPLAPLSQSSYEVEAFHSPFSR